MRPTIRWTTALTALLVATGLVAAAVPASASSRGAGSEGVDAGRITSIVVLGDSVAAGEGAADGLTYRNRSLFPGWVADGSGADPAPACGRTDAAYGGRVADALGAELTNLACSGASFARGITLDDRFDAARPDLVLVTAGANSIAFERAYAYCVLASRGVAASEAEQVVRASTVGDALVTGLGLAARRALGRGPAAPDAACTADEPGAYLEQTVLARADDVADAARALALEIRGRGRAAGRVPDIVFTTYPDPLPEEATGLALCPDGAAIGAAQLAFMHDLVATLNGALREALADVPGVRVADPDPAFAGHRWCDPDPWVYGPSIFVTDPQSRAPFHPTPAGQRATAASVLAALRAVPGEWRGTV